MELNRDFSEFIACFTARDVRFLIVGGYAVAVHGHPRYTKDLDVWVRVDPDNARRIIDALGDFGFDGLGLVVEDFLAEDVVVQLGGEPQRIDLLMFVSGVEFDEAYEHRVLVRIGEVEVPVIGRAELPPQQARDRSSSRPRRHRRPRPRAGRLGAGTPTGGEPMIRRRHAQVPTRAEASVVGRAPVSMRPITSPVRR